MCFQLLIKPAGPDCNLSCGYCFYRRVNRIFLGQRARRMSPEILKEVTRQYLGLNFEVSCFSWQGGEPTLCGLSFFRKAIELQKKHGRIGQRVSNAFQTNGLLIDKKWCSFFSEYKFLVGLSLDGPKKMHDYYRTKGHNGTWKTVMRTAKLLAEYEVEFNILTVVTGQNEGQARILFKWFVDHRFCYLQFIPCLETTPKGDIAPFSVTPGGYGDFLCELFDLWWLNRSSRISIRMFDAMLESLVFRENRLMCTFSPLCRSYLVVEHNGNIYPCDFFVREDTQLGNLTQTPLVEIFQSDSYRNFGKKKSETADECIECLYRNICHGGCQKDRLNIKGLPHRRTYLCPSYKQFFQYAWPRLEQLAKKIIAASFHGKILRKIRKK